MFRQTKHLNLQQPIFVFGSNKAGRHGKGAAKQAMAYGAVYGEGEGEFGNTYALPTKDKKIKTLSLEEIGQSYIRFWKHCLRNPDKYYYVTPFGTGLAGYSKEQIWKEVIEPKGGVLPNMMFAGSWFSSEDAYTGFLKNNT